MNKYLITALSILVAFLSSCNKDEVIPNDDDTNDGRRPATDKSSAYQTKVFDYTPAPGQFINETKTGGFTGDETTPDAAIAYAEKRLAEKKFVSLGAFGGYIVVGFDHSIVNVSNKADFAIQGNAFAECNEPGIVWVMQDTNGNGLPDDTWYELLGSDSEKSSTLRNYRVTYKRPSAAGKDVEWTDNYGNSGKIKYLKAYHNQDYYYPAWIKEDSYALHGVRLEARNYLDTIKNEWINPQYTYGYADNIDRYTVASSDGSGQFTEFHIENAVDVFLRPVYLKYIDFIKVQGAVMAQSGWTGENSCEVLSFVDRNMGK